MDFNYTPRLQLLLKATHDLAVTYHNEFFTPEHFLLACLQDGVFDGIVASKNIEPLRVHLIDLFENSDDQSNEEPEPSFLWRKLESSVALHARGSQVQTLDVTHYIAALYTLEQTPSLFAALRSLGDRGTLLSALIDKFSSGEGEGRGESDENPANGRPKAEGLPNGSSAMDDNHSNEDWRQLVTCINDHIDRHNPLIGREAELERTIRVLCRLDKNNPLHVGDPGVGKTALIYGLAALIRDGRVPERLAGARIYSLHLGTLLSGTQYRGQLEKRLLSIIDGMAEEGNAIAYIDEIHNLVGAGQTGEGSLDLANLLKPYLETGSVRFIGATTHEEYNRYFSKSGALVRRFQTIDVPEPSIEETCLILEGLRSRYEAFHNVTFAEGVIEHAVRRADRYINDRRLPDKAIDLIDEAAAYREVHPDGTQTVTRDLIDSVLATLCKIDVLRSDDDNDHTALRNLRPELLRRVFGQDRAIAEVTEAVMMSHAGLTAPDKPMASLLFVGPTGVGKTEVAKVLAEQLGIELVHFDMSEYAEKHTVSRLIGTPAGYVGYEDGGQLTDAIRRSPHCVLLLDEIEKAHPDIFNILLQVMDRATLTDTHGRKADFRHVLLILTSNAGAQFARQAGVGFTGNVTPGDAMLAEVKKLFKPEFLNRLSGTVVFGEMTLDMARRILDKQLGVLQSLLTPRGVQLQLTDAAREWLLQRGFTREYGARELDRAIAAHLKPLLTRALLFGALAHGGTATVDAGDEGLVLRENSTPKNADCAADEV